MLHARRSYRSTKKRPLRLVTYSAGPRYTVTERVGKYAQPEWTSYGVVAVMKNGAAPTVLVRTELDALPVGRENRAGHMQHSPAKNDTARKSA